MTVKSLCFLCVLVTLALFVITEASTIREIKSNKVESQKLKTFDVKPKGGNAKLKKHETVAENEATEHLEVKAKPITSESKMDKVQSVAKNSRNDIVTSSEGVEKADQWTRLHLRRMKRNATASSESKDSKKSYKKLKLAQTKAGFKTRKSKQYSNDLNPDKNVEDAKTIHRRHVISYAKRMNLASRLKRYAVTRNLEEDKSDYYAKRKAVMDRFYARQKAIAEKYAKKMSTTPRYIYRYESDKQTDKNNVSSSMELGPDKINNTAVQVDNGKNDINTSTSSTSSTTETPINSTAGVTQTESTSPASATESTAALLPETKPTQATRDSDSNQIQTTENYLEENLEEDSSNEYDYDISEDNGLKSPSVAISNFNAVQNDGEWKVDDSRSDTLKWGACSGKLVYQHNFIINAEKATQADADLSTSLEGPFCPTCIRVIPVSKTKATATIKASRDKDGRFSLVMLSFKGFQNEELFYTVKIWAVSKRNNRCDHV